MADALGPGLQLAAQQFPGAACPACGHSIQTTTNAPAMGVRFAMKIRRNRRGLTAMTEVI
jgi:hypothetical protein